MLQVIFLVDLQTLDLPEILSSNSPVAVIIALSIFVKALSDLTNRK